MPGTPSLSCAVLDRGALSQQSKRLRFKHVGGGGAPATRLPLPAIVLDGGGSPIGLCVYVSTCWALGPSSRHLCVSPIRVLGCGAFQAFPLCLPQGVMGVLFLRQQTLRLPVRVLGARTIPRFSFVLIARVHRCRGPLAVTSAHPPSHRKWQRPPASTFIAPLPRCRRFRGRLDAFSVPS